MALLFNSANIAGRMSENIHHTVLRNKKQKRVPAVVFCGNYSMGHRGSVPARLKLHTERFYKSLHILFRIHHLLFAVHRICSSYYFGFGPAQPWVSFKRWTAQIFQSKPRFFTRRTARLTFSPSKLRPACRLDFLYAPNRVLEKDYVCKGHEGTIGWIRCR